MTERAGRSFRVIPFAVLACGGALATAQMPLSALARSVRSADAAVPKQVPLDQAIIDRLIAAQPEIAALRAKAQAGEPGRRDPKIQPKLEDAARTHGFASLADYQSAADTVGIVLSGFDPETKTYVGASVLIGKQMDQVKADASLPAKDKARTLEEMRDALANVGAEQPSPQNVELVRRNYDRLMDGFQTGGE